MGKIREEIAKNILYYRKKAKLSQKEVAESLGVSIPAVSKWENGSNSIDIETLFDLCQVLGVSINDMYGMDSVEKVKPENYELLDKYSALDNRGKQLVDMILGFEYEQVINTVDEQAVTREMIRVYDAKAAAGLPLPIMTDGFTMVTDATVPKNANFGIILAGDSMEPDYPDGCTVWVRSRPDLESGDIGIFTINGEAVCKKLYQNGDVCRLISLNPKYAPIEITEDMDMRTYGKVIGHD